MKSFENMTCPNSPKIVPTRMVQYYVSQPSQHVQWNGSNAITSMAVLVIYLNHLGWHQRQFVYNLYVIDNGRLGVSTCNWRGRGWLAPNNSPPLTTVYSIYFYNPSCRWGLQRRRNVTLATQSRKSGLKQWQYSLPDFGIAPVRQDTSSMEGFAIWITQYYKIYQDSHNGVDFSASWNNGPFPAHGQHWKWNKRHCFQMGQAFLSVLVHSSANLVRLACPQKGVVGMFSEIIIRQQDDPITFWHRLTIKRT